jgi:hypothetical protein
MDDSTILLVDRRVAEARRIVASQRARVERLRGASYDASNAEQTLRAFGNSLRTLESHRDWLRNQERINRPAAIRRRIVSLDDWA